MSDLTCGKDAVGGNYNSTRDTVDISLLEFGRMYAEAVRQDLHKEMSIACIVIISIFTGCAVLGGVTLEQYILFHAAKDVYNGTKHIRLSELTDRDLIPDEILRLIVNAFVIEKCGVEIVKQEVWNAD